MPEMSWKGEMLLESTIKQIAKDEAWRLKPYRDTVGKLTIGYGRNLDDKGISKEEAYRMLVSDVWQAAEEARKIIINFDSLSDNRKSVLINMCFNLGARGLRTFVKMIRWIEMRDFAQASIEMRDSKWYTQVGNRAERLRQEMIEG